ncbi:WD40-repeat-containing domain protein [Pavlovales sp. CCMP2436]|nr:WD40-repeat-containing domain protein [Pavlovales sp. CCMP2436]
MATQTETIETLHEDLIRARVAPGAALPSSSLRGRGWPTLTPPSPPHAAAAAQHDAQLDYYGKKLATCSSDRTIRVYDVQEGTGERVQVAELKGHEGPVWQLAWAHPQFGTLLASCSYDRKVCVWKEQAPNHWVRVYLYDGHDSSVNALAWAPAELGLVLACASADTTVSILTHQADDSWTASKIAAHQIGVNGVSWAPAYEPSALLSSAGAQPPTSAQLVTGGCDNLVKVWQHDPNTQTWSLEATLAEHTDWVRDVAWAPIASSPTAVIASCSQDGRVLIWSRDASSGQWTQTALPRFEQAVWRVSWSLTGGILAVSTGDNKVRACVRSPGAAEASLR